MYGIAQAPSNQCDQIGRFLKAHADKFSHKSSPIFGEIWAVWNDITFK